MKRISLIALMFMAAAGVAVAQMQTTPTTADTLGAHLNYGRGCAACHAPHSGAYGNGAAKGADSNSGYYALWGQDVGSLYGKTIVTGLSEHGSYSETLPASLTSAADVSGILMCLSCHDGNWAKGAMMKNQVYETLPSTYGTNYATGGGIPTLLGTDGTTAGNYLNDHPVGSNAIIPCGGAANHAWDCTVSSSGGIIPGPLMTTFINNYGFFVAPKAMANQPVVLCTTCHNQHLMNVVAVTNAPLSPGAQTSAVSSGASGLPAGNYATMFFIRAPYNPADSNPLTNQTAQFCRQCHGDHSNEENGSTAGTIF